jgi:hypothetical protein
MKRVLVLIAMLFSQVFFTSGNVQCADIKPIEDGKGNLFPANNDEK